MNLSIRGVRRVLPYCLTISGLLSLSGCAMTVCNTGYEYRQVAKYVCDYETYSSGGVVQTRQTNCRNEYVTQKVCKAAPLQANAPQGDYGHGFKYHDVNSRADQKKASSRLSNMTLRGEYKCLQGRTTASLQLFESDGEKIRGVFRFDAPSASGTGEPVTGAFKVELDVFSTHMRTDLVYSSREPLHYYVSMRPLEWLEQPAGYVMLEASALKFYGRVPISLFGKLDTAGCESIDLKRGYSYGQ